MSDDTATLPTTPYARLGGAAGMRRLADAFYDIMDTDPACRELRDMHGPDLAPTRDALAGFLTAWLGGPRDWLVQRGGFCIMSRHASMNVTPATARQWLDAMRHAIAAINTPPDLASKMDQALTQLAEAMVRHGRNSGG